jgi:hypothetical protein
MKKFILFFIFHSLISLSFSQSTNLLLKGFLDDNNLSMNNLDIKVETLILKNNKCIQTYYTDFFFLSILTDEETSQIVAYSIDNGLTNTEQLNFHNQLLSSMWENAEIKKIKTLEKSGKAETYGPYLTSLFGQSNCHDENGQIINVSNIYCPSNAPVGCVAISLASVLHYYEWPNSGSGNISYMDNIGKLKNTHEVNFEIETINWSQIVKRYDYEKTTKSEREELAKLCYHSAVAIEMDFEMSGSTSNVNKIPLAFSRYFKHYGEYIENTSSQFFDKIDSMMHKKSIVILSISGNGFGHSIICDGLKLDNTNTKYYHLNMGWWGNSNGWYTINSSFNAGGYTIIDGGIFNILPAPDIKANYQHNTFYLSWENSDFFESNGYELQVKIGRNNWKTIANLTSEKTFEYENNENANYAFRVRQKYSNFQNIVAWSNTAQYDNSITKISYEVNPNKIIIYPNPSNNYINIETSQEYFHSPYEIISMYGHILIYGNLSDINKSIYIGNLKPEMYILKIYNQNTTISKIFIKN